MLSLLGDPAGIPPRQEPPQAAVALRHAHLHPQGVCRIRKAAKPLTAAQRMGVEPRRGNSPHRDKRKNRLLAVSSFGDPAGIRTPDTLLNRQVLCRLSYWVMAVWMASRRFLAGMAGLEPANAGVKVPCLTAWLHPCIEDFGKRSKAKGRSRRSDPSALRS